MYAPKTAGFSPERTGKIHTVTVEICTRYAEGPRPVAYSPPKYDELFQDLDDDQERTRHNTFSPGTSIPLAILLLHTDVFKTLALCEGS